MELLEESLARYPKEEYAYVLLAIVHLTSNRRDQGLAVLASGIKAVPDSGLLRSYYGYGMLRNGRYPEAFRQFESYAQMYPADANPYERLGEAYLVAGMPDRALEEYSCAPGGNGSLVSSSFGRSWASAMMGHYDEALAYLDETHHAPTESAPSLLLVQAFLLSRVGPDIPNPSRVCSRGSNWLEAGSTGCSRLGHKYFAPCLLSRRAG